MNIGRRSPAEYYNYTSLKSNLRSQCCKLDGKIIMQLYLNFRKTSLSRNGRQRHDEEVNLRYLFFPYRHRAEPVERNRRSGSARAGVTVQARVVVSLDRAQLRTLLGTSGWRFGPASVGRSVDSSADDVFFQLTIDSLPLGVRASEQLREDEQRSVNSVFLLLKRPAGVVGNVNGHKSGECRVVTGFVPSLLENSYTNFNAYQILLTELIINRKINF